MGHRYREAIIAFSILLVCLLAILHLIVWIFAPISIPTEGKWYCAELDTMLDFSETPYSITHVVADQVYTDRLYIDYGGRCYFAPFNDEQKRQKYGSIVKTFIDHPSKIILYINEQKEKYTFNLLR